MLTATIRVVVDPAIKRAAAANAKAAGVDLPTLVRGFVSQLAKEPAAARRTSLMMKLPPRWTLPTVARI
ncbi:MAG: hypothetical protein LBD30_00245 [Verrucomicrobiales bacterium]|jgi:hypothetical protein|nr:hypothetical protein [Verrucomicrobiales bacterium]